MGAGGFAREVEWLIEDIGQHDFAGFFVTDRAHMNDIADGDLEDLYFKFFECQIDSVVIGVGDPILRADLFARVARDIPGIRWSTLIHPSVIIDKRSSVVGEGSIICAGSIISHAPVRCFLKTISHELLFQAAQRYRLLHEHGQHPIFLL